MKKNIYAAMLLLGLSIVMVSCEKEYLEPNETFSSTHDAANKPLTRDGGHVMTDPRTHMYVDLGLPSGLLWATMNIGANYPEDCGESFAWGETSVKSDYTWGTYSYCDGGFDKLTKYNVWNDYGTIDNKIILDKTDDVAYIKWGDNWRMPTDAEWKELMNSEYCTWTWTKNGGVNGYKVTSNSIEASIFLPAAGYRLGVGIDNPGNTMCGEYWSSSLVQSDPNLAWYVYFFSNQANMGGYDRYHAAHVRAVCEP